MFSKTPYSAYPPAQKRPTNSGFTLIELLMVIAVIMVLAGITFGISRGVQNAQARAQAKAELAVIAQALEGFKSAHGDYPWTTDSNDLAKALLGWMKFVRSSGSTTFVGLKANDVSAQGPKSFLDATKLNYLGQLPTEANKAPSNVKFTDPWGNAYIYKYRTGASGSWENFGYVLYSTGSDSAGTSVGNDGILTTAIRDSSDNIDNIYSGE